MQPETIARKTTGDSPLLETGELRDSIKWNSDKHEAYVGTDNPKGIWHEFGTGQVTPIIPPRPFLGAAMVASEKEIHKIFERNVARAFAGGGELMELFRGLREIGHEAKELGEQFMDDTMDNKRTELTEYLMKRLMPTANMLALRLCHEPASRVESALETMRIGLRRTWREFSARKRRKLSRIIGSR